MRPVIPYVTAALLFGLGVYGVLRRRNAILVLMAVELMLNAVNLMLVTADVTVRQAAAGPHSGGVFAVFVIVLAAAEVGVGLAIVLQYYRMRARIAVDEVPLDPAVSPDPAGSPDAVGSPAPDPSAARTGPVGGQRVAG